MTNKLILILTLLTYHELDAQRSLGLEQYGSFSRKAPALPVTRVWYQTPDGGYVEARYNYDVEKTGGVSLGWTFSASSASKRYGRWSFTPTIGLIAGATSAAGMGMNVDWTLGRFEASTIVQSPLAYPWGGRHSCYSWTEARFEVCRKLALGVALQQEPGQEPGQGAAGPWHPGIELAFVAGPWNIPIYVFDPFLKNTWLMAGVSREWSLSIKSQTLKRPSPR
jgi:hypothetical protein